MCKCRSDIEARLVDRIKDQIPEGSKELSVRLEGYALVFGDDLGLTMKNVLPIKIEYQAPVKKGGFKTKKQTMNMTGNYCMFCGGKYPVKEESAA